jgi:hypothetical protein
VQTRPWPFGPQPPGRTQPGLLVLVMGLGGTLVALFGLPLQATTSSFGNSFYFGDIRRYSHPAVVARVVMSPVAAAWWNYLGYLLAGLLVLLVAVTAAAPAVRRSIAQVTAALGAATAAIYTIALIQTSHLERVFVTFRRTGTSFDADRYGIWVTYAGLVVLVAGAILVAVTTPLSPAPAVAAVEPDHADSAAEPDSADGTDGTAESNGTQATAGAAGPDAATERDGADEQDGADGTDSVDRTDSADRTGGAGEAADREGAGPATGAR